MPDALPEEALVPDGTCCFCNGGFPERFSLRNGDNDIALKSLQSPCTPQRVVETVMCQKSRDVEWSAQPHAQEADVCDYKYGRTHLPANLPLASRAPGDSTAIGVGLALSNSLGDLLSSALVLLPETGLQAHGGNTAVAE